MKIRYGFFLAAVVLFLIAAVFIDRAGLLLGNASQSGAIPETNMLSMITLRSCDSQSGSYIGPLIPTPNTSNSYSRTMDEQPEPQVPAGTRSSRAGFSISTPTDPYYWAGRLGSGWYLDWGVQIILPPSSLNIGR